MTPVKAVLLALIGAIVNSWMMGGAFGMQIASRPLITGMLCGMVLGQVSLGIKVGCALQAIYLGVVYVGGSVTPTITISQWFAIPIAILTCGGDATKAAEICTAIAVPFSYLETFDMMLMVNVNLIFVRWQDKLIKQGKLKRAYWAPFSTIFTYLGKMLLITVPINLLGTTALDAVMANLPSWLLDCFSTFGGMMPLLGFGLLLTILCKDKLNFVYYILGFALVKVLNLSTISVCIIASVFAVINYRCYPSIQAKEGGAN